MYTSIQIQCLQQLGIQLYEVNPKHQQRPEVKSQSTLSWESVSSSFVDDLLILFPNLKQKGDELVLSPQLKWLLIDSEIKITENELHTPLPQSLNAPAKAAIWQKISSILSDES